MTKETGLSLIRAILTLVGSYLLGKQILGSVVDQNWLIIVITGAVTLASVIWGIVSKDIAAEQVASGLRSVIMSVGMIFVASGKLSTNNLEQVALIVVTVIPFILSKLNRDTNKEIANPNNPVTADLKTGKVIVKP